MQTKSKEQIFANCIGCSRWSINDEVSPSLQVYIYEAMDEWHTQQSIADTERINELEAELDEIRFSLPRADVVDILEIIERVNPNQNEQAKQGDRANSN